MPYELEFNRISNENIGNKDTLTKCEEHKSEFQTKDSDLIAQSL
jgi:hypothetical protein